MATFTPDDKFFLKDTHTGLRIPGEFSAKAAKARALVLAFDTGHYIDLLVVGSKSAERGESVAGADQWGFHLHQPHDDEGNSLPFQPWPGDDVEDGN